MAEGHAAVGNERVPLMPMIELVVGVVQDYEQRLVHVYGAKSLGLYMTNESLQCSE